MNGVFFSKVLTDAGDSIVLRSKASLDKSNDLLAQAQGLSTQGKTFDRQLLVH